MINLDKLRESEGYMFAIVNTKTGEYEPVSGDVITVIRCKYCKYRTEYGYCTFHPWHHLTGDSDYCSDAKRKEE